MVEDIFALIRCPTCHKIGQYMLELLSTWTDGGLFEVSCTCQERWFECELNEGYKPNLILSDSWRINTLDKLKGTLV